MDEVLYIIAYMGKNYAKVVEYLKARLKDSTYPNANVSSILKYVDMKDDEQGPLSFKEACEKYILAHKIGFDCMKAIASDYLLTFLDKDLDNVLFILEAALIVHDEDLFNKAIFSFLNNFHKVIRSKKFEFYSDHKAPISRLIIHSARVWITKNGKFIFKNFIAAKMNSNSALKYTSILWLSEILCITLTLYLFSMLLICKFFLIF